MLLLKLGNVKHILLLGILLDTCKSQMPIEERNFYPSCSVDIFEEAMKPGAVSERKQRLLSANTLLHSITRRRVLRATVLISQEKKFKLLNQKQSIVLHKLRNFYVCVRLVFGRNQ